MIKDEDQFKDLTENELKKVIVIDTHLEWCGPCTCMENNYVTLWFKIDQPETRLCFWQCSEDFIGQELRDKL